MKELITKSADGNFILNPAGEQELYLITTKKLIQYYLKEFMKKDDASVAKIMNSLSGFIISNFKKVDDYLKKLPDLASFIQEPNLDKFQKFMGQYFITTLQKEKQILINKEVQLVKDVLDNPFWAPSNQMLKSLESEFLKAPPQKYPLDDQNKPATQMPVKTDKKESKNQEMVLPVPGNEPGVLLLQTLEKSFLEAKPLDFNVFESKITDESDGSQEIQKKKEKSTSEVMDNQNLDPPGVQLLLNLGSLFQGAPQLELSDNVLKSEAQPGRSGGQKQLNIKVFATILSNISKFTKNKDSNGYQIWYNNLDAKLKGAVKINSLLNSEKKGNPINWGQEILSFASSTNSNKDELYQILEEVKLYTRIINFIRHRLTADPKIKLTQQEASNIYIQSINILSGNEGPGEKKSAIALLLLQITDTQMREILVKDFEKILSSHH